MESVFTASTHDFILFFSSRGQVYVRKGYQIPEAGRSARGTNIVNILPLEPEEKISAMLRGKGLQEDDFIMFFTKNGVTKRMVAARAAQCPQKRHPRARHPRGRRACAALTTHGSEKLLVVTRGGMAIRFDENDVRPMAARPPVCAPSVSRTATRSSRRCAPRTRTRRCSPLPKTATASAPASANTACRGAAVRVSRPTRSRRKPARSSARRRSPARRISFSYRTTARSSAWRPAASRFSAAPTQGVRLMRPAEGAHVVAMARTEREASEEETAEPGESAVEITEE